MVSREVTAQAGDPEELSWQIPTDGGVWVQVKPLVAWCVGRELSSTTPPAFTGSCLVELSI